MDSSERGEGLTEVDAGAVAAELAAELAVELAADLAVELRQLLLEAREVAKDRALARLVVFMVTK